MQRSIIKEYPPDSSYFKVHEFDISIKDEQLEDTLMALFNDKREIVLRAYFLKMSDPEIAELFPIVRQTVQYHRVRSLEELRKRMEAARKLDASGLIRQP